MHVNLQVHIHCILKYVFEFQIYHEVININDMKFNKHTIRRFVVLDKCFTRSPQTLHSEAPSILSHREKYVHTGLFFAFCPRRHVDIGKWELEFSILARTNLRRRSYDIEILLYFMLACPCRL